MVIELLRKGTHFGVGHGSENPVESHRPDRILHGVGETEVGPGTHS